MVEDVLKKYGKITDSTKREFWIELKGNPDNFLESIEKELPEYAVEILEQRGKSVRIKVQKDLFKAMLNKIKSYKEGIPPEDLQYSDVD